MPELETPEQLPKVVAARPIELPLRPLPAGLPPAQLSPRAITPDVLETPDTASAMEVVEMPYALNDDYPVRLSSPIVSTDAAPDPPFALRPGRPGSAPGESPEALRRAESERSVQRQSERSVQRRERSKTTENDFGLWSRRVEMQW